MPRAIAFFPWVTIEEARTVGSLRLLPYDSSERSGTSDHVAQADIDGVLAAYALSKNELVSRVTLVELGAWNSGDDVDPETQSKLFTARELVAFAALAERRLFRGHFDYCNFDTYAFVVQYFQPGKTGSFSFSTRRRDSVTRHLWTAQDFAFLKPLHVAAHARMQFENGFLEALLRAADEGRLPYEPIIEFNRANTDSEDVPTHLEVVLTKSAFEYLFDIGQGVNEFVEGLRQAIPERATADLPDGPVAQRWKDARPKALRPLEAWAREFCDLRGGAAHGQKRGGARFVWSEEAHLAFASILFPLLIKRRLQDSIYALRERDAVEIESVEDYLMYDPFQGRDPEVQEADHPWNRVYDGVAGEVMRRGIAREVRKIDWADLPKE